MQKIDELRQLVTLHDYDIISVTESWATAGIRDAELSVEGFSMYRVDAGLLEVVEWCYM